ncbi:hypothetical protein PR048_004359 [Dryococelus australis]|uniref:Uncharacterized protein n=1 Tax=Dryococelus australis TaxID=614101 RepID=A0ABQ9I689_9NEOP|nr:hypothetical protein PR048_004359 [Dryococelus australis]
MTWSRQRWHEGNINTAKLIPKIGRMAYQTERSRLCKPCTRVSGPPESPQRILVPIERTAPAVILLLSLFLQDFTIESLLRKFRRTTRVVRPARLPPRRTVFNLEPFHSRIFANGNRAGRFRWSVGFLTVSPAHSFRCCSILTPIALIGSQDLAVKRRANIFARSLTLSEITIYLSGRHCDTPTAVWTARRPSAQMTNAPSPLGEGDHIRSAPPTAGMGTAAAIMSHVDPGGACTKFFFRKCREKFRFTVVPGNNTSREQYKDDSRSTKANRVRFPAVWPPDFRKWESGRAMSLVGGFSRVSPVSPVLVVRCNRGILPPGGCYPQIGKDGHPRDRDRKRTTVGARVWAGKTGRGRLPRRLSEPISVTRCRPSGMSPLAKEKTILYSELEPRTLVRCTRNIALRTYFLEDVNSVPIRGSFYAKEMLPTTMT